ncbi:uncharacterized protein LOC141536138 isoform X1 [Cotesia typhae]|uniref:uncharacterized protein LOC141536138 isoform X1 n=1 Tax=Cotesia typhae TaxID=2053667 RepID=UPI003D693257
MNLQLKPNNTNPEPKLNIDYNALLFSKDGEPAKYYCPTANCKRSFKHKNQLQFHLRNQCGKPPRFFRTPAAKVPLSELHEQVQAKGQSDTAFEVRVRARTEIQVPLLHLPEQENLSYLFTHTDQAY